MKFPIKIKGIELPANGIQQSLDAIKRSLERRGTLFGDIRNSSKGMIIGADFPTPHSIDFGVTGAAIDGNFIVYNVDILNPTYATCTENDFYVVAGYYKRDRIYKDLVRLALIYKAGLNESIT